MIRSAPLTRKTPLRRTRMKRRPRKRQATKAEKAFMAMVADEPCVFSTAQKCEGPIQLHHHGRKGLSQKVSNYMVSPLCMKHHTQWTDHAMVTPFDRDITDLIIVRAQVRLLVRWAERCDPDVF